MGLLSNKSGRDMDKIAAVCLTPVDPEVISVQGPVKVMLLCGAAEMVVQAALAAGL